nr:alpha-hydroxy-acid oxidizing protein [Pseudomonadota bacterium]
SNHGGRQFDGGMSSIEALPLIKTALDAAKLNPAIVFDSGVENGLDIIRAVALGADFVMLGRAFHYGLAAFGTRGGEHVVHILRDDLRTNMAQMGIENLSQARALLIND